MALGDVLQTVTYIDATTTTANVPPSHPTWTTPTSGNTLLFAVAGSTALSAGPTTGGTWTNLLSYNSTYNMYIWHKVSNGTENPINATMAAADGTQVYAVEIEGAPDLDGYGTSWHNTVASGTQVSITTPSTSSATQTAIAIVHAWATPPSVNIVMDGAWTLGINYDSGNNAEAYNQNISYRTLSSQGTVSGTASWTGGATDFGQVAIVTFDLVTEVGGDHDRIIDLGARTSTRRVVR
jgi:hypothetical protein